MNTISDLIAVSFEDVSRAMYRIRDGIKRTVRRSDSSIFYD